MNVKMIIALATAALLVAFGSCAQAQKAKQTQLAADIAKSGVVIGKPLAPAIKAESNTSLVTAGPGEQGLICANGGLHIGADGNVDIMVISDPKIAPSRPALSTITLTAADGRNLFGLSEGDITQLYGEPSEIRDTGTRQSPNRTYIYYFSKGKMPYAVISLPFKLSGGGSEPLSSVSCSLAKDYEVSEITSKGLKIFPWPKGI